MTTIEMRMAASMSVASVMAAYEEINKIEAGSHQKSVPFVELSYAPGIDEMHTAELIGAQLLRHGIGVKLRLDWGFTGTTSWALQTERTRVVNRGM